MKDITVKTTVTATDIKNWNWELSVSKVQGLFLNRYKTVSKELIEELITAKKNIGSTVGNPHGRYTWKQYCLDCFQGTPTQRTVDNWISRFMMGEEAWSEKLKKAPVAIDIDSQFITYSKNNADGTYTIRISVSEYDELFEETFAA